MPSANKWEIKKVQLDELELYDENPRQIDDKAFKALMKSMERFGYVEPIVWNAQTRRIVGGHQRYKALLENGVEEAHVVVVEMSDEEELAANLTLNNPEIQGDWDEPVLDLLSQVKSSDVGLFDDLRFDDLQNVIDRTPQSSSGEDASSDEFDTQCPCCNHQWDVTPDDVEMVE
jgi:hypothetical protein